MVVNTNTVSVSLKLARQQIVHQEDYCSVDLILPAAQQTHTGYVIVHIIYYGYTSRKEKSGFVFCQKPKLGYLSFLSI
jgi:hypothetical protein